MAETMQPQIFFVAGDHSGDLHGGNLIREIKKICPGAGISGLGGVHMAEAGCDIRYDLTKLSIMWFRRVYYNLHRVYRIQRETLDSFDADPPDALVLIDYPGFNLTLARWMKKRPVPVIYYIPPQIWAWFTHRVYKIRERVQKVLTVLPFENHFYERAGVPVEYVGHPLFDHLRLVRLDEEFISGLRKGDGPLVGLLPGSREQEVQRLLPVMLRACQELRGRLPNIRFVVALGERIRPEIARGILERYGIENLVMVQGKTYEVMKAADCSLVTSGTATLELAYFGRPMVVLCRLNPLSHLIGRTFMKTSYMALVNVVAGSEIVPEMLLYRDDPIKVAREVERFLKERGARLEAKENLRRVVGLLDVPGASRRAAFAILQTVEEYRSKK